MRVRGGVCCRGSLWYKSIGTWAERKSVCYMSITTRPGGQHDDHSQSWGGCVYCMSITVRAGGGVCVLHVHRSHKGGMCALHVRHCQSSGGCMSITARAGGVACPSQPKLGGERMCYMSITARAGRGCVCYMSITATSGERMRRVHHSHKWGAYETCRSQPQGRNACIACRSQPQVGSAGVMSITASRGVHVLHVDHSQN
mgnify:CR=1 FL=1